MIIQYFANCSFALILAFACLIYLNYFENGKKQDKFDFLGILKSNKKTTIITIVFFIVLTFVTTFFARKNGFTEYSLLRNLTYVFSLYLLSVTDIRKKIIPNQVILFMLLVRIPFLGAEIYFNSSEYSFLLKKAALGFVLSTFVALFMYLISRHQMGGGDVKLLALIGWYVGSTDVFTVMLFSFIYSAVVGLTLMAIKKYKVKDTIPFAPFVFMGMLTYFLMVYIPGIKY